MLTSSTDHHAPSSTTYLLTKNKTAHHHIDNLDCVVETYTWNKRWRSPVAGASIATRALSWVQATRELRSGPRVSIPRLNSAGRHHYELQHNTYAMWGHIAAATHVQRWPELTSDTLLVYTQASSQTWMISLLSLPNCCTHFDIFPVVGTLKHTKDHRPMNG